MTLMDNYKRCILFILLCINLVFVANCNASELLIKNLENSIESCYPDILNALKNLCGKINCD